MLAFDATKMRTFTFKASENATCICILQWFMTACVRDRNLSMSSLFWKQKLKICFSETSFKSLICWLHVRRFKDRHFMTYKNYDKITVTDSKLTKRDTDQVSIMHIDYDKVGFRYT